MQLVKLYVFIQLTKALFTQMGISIFKELLLDDLVVNVSTSCSNIVRVFNFFRCMVAWMKSPPPISVIYFHPVFLRLS